MENIFQIIYTKLWFNNRTWLINKKSVNIMMYRNINIGSKNQFQRSKKIISEDLNTRKNIYCSGDYCLSARIHPFTFQGSYFSIKVGESRERRYFSSVVDSTLNFSFGSNVSYKRIIRVDVAVVDKFTETIIYQDIIQYGWNRGVDDRRRNLRKFFDYPTTSAQDMMCAEITDHYSSGYPYMECRVNGMLHRTQSSGKISCEGNNINDVDLDLFFNYHIPPRNFYGKKNSIFN